MNWQFGYGLGQSEVDGQLLGAASAAADCLKALIPFFFFAALRNKMWSQAIAAAVLGLVVVSYSMTSALGFAAKQRADTTAGRQQVTETYEGLKSDLKRAEDAAKWTPEHRPYETVLSSIEGHKAQAAWKWSNGCTKATSRTEQKYCQQFHALEAELAAAKAAQGHDLRIAEIKAKMAGMEGSAAMSVADPQAKVLADLTSIVIPGVSVENVATAMSVFVALLLEIGSSFGLYVAFSQWRITDAYVPAAPRMRREIEGHTVAATVAVPALAVAVPVQTPHSGANDNRSIDVAAVQATIAAHVQEEEVAEVKTEVKVEAMPAVKMKRPMPPENDVERYYKECVVSADGEFVTQQEMFEDYCSWCESKKKEPLAQVSFVRGFAELGIKKDKINGKTRWVGVTLADAGHGEATRTLTYQGAAA
jgi:hypothetical protein